MCVREGFLRVSGFHSSNGAVSCAASAKRLAMSFSSSMLDLRVCMFGAKHLQLLAIARMAWWMNSFRVIDVLVIK